jgi:hypothetical protein
VNDVRVCIHANARTLHVVAAVPMCATPEEIVHEIEGLVACEPARHSIELTFDPGTRPHELERALKRLYHLSRPRRGVYR